MRKKVCFRFLVFVLLIVLFSFICLCEETKKAEQKDEKLETIDYYLKDKIDDFMAVSIDGRNKIYETATPNQRKELVEKIVEEIYKNKKVKDNSPKTLKVFGIESTKIKFGGEDGRYVLSDGHVAVDLENLPSYISSVYYVEKDEKTGESVFVLKSEDGIEIKIEGGATNINGELDFIQKRENKIGDQTLSSNLNDYQFKGKIRITDEGFVFEEKGSEVLFGEFNIGRNQNAETGEVKFTDYGVIMTGCYLLKDKEFAVKPNLEDKPFSVVFGSDWSAFLGKDYPSEISFTDAGRGFSIWTGPESSKTYGEMKIHVNDDGSVYSFEKDGYSLNLKQVESIEALENYDIYKSSSPTVQEIMRSIVKDNSKGNMQYIEAALFNDNEIVKQNEKLAGDFLKTANLDKAATGIGVYRGSDGKLNIFANSKDEGCKLILYKDVNTMSVYSTAERNSDSVFELNVNPSSGNTMDFEISSFGISKKGVTEDFEFGIEEIRNLKSSGAFEYRKSLYQLLDPEDSPLSQITSISEGKNGKYELTLGTRATVASFTYEPNKDSLIVNNGELKVSGLGLSLAGATEKAKEMITTFGNSRFGSFAKNLVLRAMTDINSIEQNSIVGDGRISVDVGDLAKIQGSLLGVEDFSQEMKKTNFKVELAVNIPEFETTEAVLKTASALTQKDSSEISEKLTDARKSIVEKGLTQKLIQGVVGTSFMSSTTTTEVYTNVIDFYPDSAPFEARLRQEYVNDISRGIGQVVGSMSLEGQTSLVIKNNPKTNSVSVVLFNNGVETPVNLEEGTKTFIRDSLIMSFNTPSKIRTFSDGWVVNVVNCPVLPNRVYETFCRSVGYGPGLCGGDTKDRAEEYFDKYYLQSK